MQHQEANTGAPGDCEHAQSSTCSELNDTTMTLFSRVLAMLMSCR
jgi:hypothetical protein